MAWEADKNRRGFVGVVVSKADQQLCLKGQNK